MIKLFNFKNYFRSSRLLTLMFTTMHEVTADTTPPAMSVEVTTDKPAYTPGEEVTVQVHLKNFSPNDHGYSYLNFIVQYDSNIFDNTEYLHHSCYKEDCYTAGNEVDNSFEFNFISPVDGSIYFGKNTSMRGIDIQVEANNTHALIPAVDQTLVTFKLRIKEDTLASTSLISLANEFTRIRTSISNSSVYLYSPDVTSISSEPTSILPSITVSTYSQYIPNNPLA